MSWYWYVSLVGGAGKITIYTGSAFIILSSVYIILYCIQHTSDKVEHNSGLQLTQPLHTSPPCARCAVLCLLVVFWRTLNTLWWHYTALCVDQTVCIYFCLWNLFCCHICTRLISYDGSVPVLCICHNSHARQVSYPVIIDLHQTALCCPGLNPALAEYVEQIWYAFVFLLYIYIYYFFYIEIAQIT